MFAAEKLACRRAGRLVFHDVGFTLHAGDALLLQGANGTGKSSLLRLLAGFLAPAAGRIVWNGYDIAGDMPAHRARLHVVGHLNAIHPVLTVRESLATAAGLAGSSSAGVDTALQAVALTAQDDLPCRWLSAGQRRRLALARLVAVERPLWLLDEPGVGLDRASRARLEAMIAAYRAAGGVVVVASHGDVTLSDALRLDFGD